MFRIGDFARLAQITTRALRLYDRLGLLKPAVVDPFTGYRYYTLDQLPRLNRILALKDLGFSLEQIARLLDRDLPADELRGMLRLKHAELEQHAREALDRLGRVEARLRQIELEDVMPDYEIVLKKIQAANEDPNCAACKGLQWIRSGVKPESLPEDVFMKRIEVPAGEAPQPPAEPIFFIRSTALPGLAVGAEPPPPPPAPDESMVTMPFVEAHTLPGVETAATTLHAGSRDNLLLACRALVDWIDANGYRVAGHYQEVTLREGELYELILPVLRA